MVSAMRLAALLCALASAGPAFASSVMKEPPADPDKSARYLFYMHGASVEHGQPVEGVAVEYEAILKAFADRGFTAMGERRGPVANNDYARKIAGQVRALLAAGVPGANIAVAGHSKGGAIALIVSSMVQNDAVAYANLAGCAPRGVPGLAGSERMYQYTVENMAPAMSGRLLSAFDKADKVAQSCKEVFDRAQRLKEKKELLLATGKGHALFARPEKIWIELVAAWAEGRSS
jgi:hypothetical protein